MAPTPLPRSSQTLTQPTSCCDLAATQRGLASPCGPAARMTVWLLRPPTVFIPPALGAAQGSSAGPQLSEAQPLLRAPICRHAMALGWVPTTVPSLTAHPPDLPTAYQACTRLSSKKDAGLDVRQEEDASRQAGARRQWTPWSWVARQGLKGFSDDLVRAAPSAHSSRPVQRARRDAARE